MTKMDVGENPFVLSLKKRAKNTRNLYSSLIKEYPTLIQHMLN